MPEEVEACQAASFKGSKSMVSLVYMANYLFASKGNPIVAGAAEKAASLTR